MPKVKRRKDVEAIIKKVIKKKFKKIDVKKLARETSFKKDLGVESLELVELVIDFEKAFKVEITDEEAEKIQTYGDAIEYMKEAIHKKAIAKQKKKR